MEIIKETGHEGEIHGCMQILSMHKKKGKYYTRVNLGEECKIALLDYEEVVNNILPDKFQGKLVGNPYWHLTNGVTVLFDINGKEIYIDTDDFDRVKHITWRAHPPTCGRSIDNTWYAFGGKWDKETKKWTQYALHRYVMDVLDNNEIQIDHIDLNGLNNQKCNLRTATNTENARHKSLYKNNELGFTGVRQLGNKYEARIRVDGKLITLGICDDIEEAKRLRLEAEKKYFGVFSTARFNDK